MEEMKSPDPTNIAPELEEEFELNHSDKLVGVFTEPGKTFAKMSLFNPKTVDWLLPVILLIIVAIVSNFMMMSNTAIKYSIIEKQMKRIEKNLDDMVEAGQLSAEQRDEQLDNIQANMENQMAAGMIIQAVSIFVITFIVFFVIAGFYFLIAKPIYKGEGTYASSMVAYGLPYYILVIQVIAMVIVAYTTNKFMPNFSVAAFMDADTSTFAGYLLSKVDPFSIWFYSVVGIGLAKMFKSNETMKYVLTIIGLWLGVSILFFFLAQAVPFLRFFLGA